MMRKTAIILFLGSLMATVVLPSRVSAGWTWLPTTYAGTYSVDECSGTAPHCSYRNETKSWWSGVAVSDADWTPCCGGATASTVGYVTYNYRWSGGAAPTSAIFRITTSQSWYASDGASVAASYSMPSASFTQNGGTRYCTFEMRCYTGPDGTITATFPVGCTATATSSGSGHMSVSAGCSGAVLHDTWTLPTADRTVTPVPGDGYNRGWFPSGGSFDDRIGGTEQGDGDPVDLATGEDMYLPNPDIVVYNPYGLSAVYQRNFISKRAKAGYASYGLSTGWVDNFDIKITPDSNDPDTWKDMILTYPNGATEVYSPTITGDEPTGAFTGPAGTNRIVTGVKSSTPGQWQSLKVIFYDRVSWLFTPAESDTYRLAQINNQLGRYISIQRNPANSYRVNSIHNDAAQDNLLLSFTYNSGRLQSVTDVYGRTITYSFGSSAGATCLLVVSQIGSESTAPPPHYTYGYTEVQGEPHLTSVSSPNPAGSSVDSTLIINYNADGQVSSLVDANGNSTSFYYDMNDTTAVKVGNSQGSVDSKWSVSFDPLNKNRLVGMIDAKNYVASREYGDANNPGRPTKVTDKMGRIIQYSYDDFGNVHTVTNPRNTVTTYDYLYPDEDHPDRFPLGTLNSIQEGSKTPTTYTYYEPSGLAHTVNTPRPGTTDGSTVTTTFTYDDLGNVLTVTTPGNNAGTTITTTYIYTTDGEYAQPARLGQPLTITDNLGHVTHFRYDERGNVISKKDALGNETNYTYNLADQLVSTILPSTQSQ